jgi:hypothetical protein
MFHFFGIGRTIQLTRYFPGLDVRSLMRQGRWRIDDEDMEYWIEDRVPWGEPMYPSEDSGEESPSTVDEEGSGSEFAPSGSTSD